MLDAAAAACEEPAAMLSLADGCVRTLLVLLSALCPPFSPLSVRPTVEPRTAALRVGLGLVVLFAVALGSPALVRRSRLGALSFALLLVAAIALALVADDGWGPIGRWGVLLSPLAWVGTCAFLLARSDRSRVPRALRGPRGPVWLGLGIAAALVALALPRMATRERALRTAVERDPGNERVVVALAASLRVAGRATEIPPLFAACARANPDACACLRGSAEALLERGSSGEALALLEQSTATCRRDASFVALRADALVRSGQVVVGVFDAEKALRDRPGDAHALHAKALALLESGDGPAALELAKLAVSAGGGPASRLLLARVLGSKGDIASARREIDAVSALDTNAAAPKLELARLEDAQNHYRAAREGYLAALRADPNLADARAALVSLTLRNGALGEAQHHLEKLAAVAPNDPRLPAFRAALTQKP